MVSTVTQVEEVKMVLKLLPIWSTCLLFWTVYSQMTTFSVEQATYTDRNIGPSFVYPSGSLSVFLLLSIFLVTSLNEKLLVPFARRITKNPQGLTSLQRIATGHLFSIFAMATAALMEEKRRNLAVHHDTKIHVFWLLPQYILVGAGEAFVYVGELEFFIREAPLPPPELPSLFVTPLPPPLSLTVECPPPLATALRHLPSLLPYASTVCCNHS